MADDIQFQLNKWRAPWTPAQVEALTAYQREEWFHPYTCGNKSSHPKLVPTEKGWHCVACYYTQNWAHPLPDDWRTLFPMIDELVGLTDVERNTYPKICEIPDCGCVGYEHS